RLRRKAPALEAGDRWGGGMRTPRPIAVYLRDHETAAQAGARAFRRVARSHRSRPWGADVAHLEAQVREDVRTEQRILRARRVRRRRLAGPLASLGEREGAPVRPLRR
ncbi:hypothetical protein, partial [Burkholderia cenocepacia]|uniref:hypothetical protein n=1 Tax=Burkholderia cenocepacia TaxID=95486 RepID=UPI0038CC1BFF